MARAKAQLDFVGPSIPDEIAAQRAARAAALANAGVLRADPFATSSPGKSTLAQTLEARASQAVGLNVSGAGGVAGGALGLALDTAMQEIAVFGETLSEMTALFGTKMGGFFSSLTKGFDLMTLIGGPVGVFHAGLEGVASAFGHLVMQTESVSRGQQIMDAAFGKLVDATDKMIKPFLGVAQVVSEIIVDVFAPLLQGDFKGLAVALHAVVSGFGVVVLSLLEFGARVSQISHSFEALKFGLMGNQDLAKLAQDNADAEGVRANAYSAARNRLLQGTLDEANARAENTFATREATEALREFAGSLNVPGFKGLPGIAYASATADPYAQRQSQTRFTGGAVSALALRGGSRQ